MKNMKKSISIIVILMMISLSSFGQTTINSPTNNPTLIVVIPSMSMSAIGGYLGNITITATSWTITSSNFFTFTPSSGTNIGVVSITSTPNASIINTRSDIITIVGGGRKIPISYTQDRKLFGSIAGSNFILNPNDSQFTVSITSNFAYSIVGLGSNITSTSESSGLHLFPLLFGTSMYGYSNASNSFSITPNTTYSDILSTFTVVGFWGTEPNNSIAKTFLHVVTVLQKALPCTTIVGNVTIDGVSEICSNSNQSFSIASISGLTNRFIMNNISIDGFSFVFNTTLNSTLNNGVNTITSLLINECGNIIKTTTKVFTVTAPLSTPIISGAATTVGVYLFTSDINVLWSNGNSGLQSSFNISSVGDFLVSVTSSNICGIVSSSRILNIVTISSVITLPSDIVTTPSPITSLGDFEQAETISVFPNPFTESVTIENYTGLVTIFNLNGEVVVSRMIVDRETFQIEKNGMYILRTNSKSFKIIKLD